MSHRHISIRVAVAVAVAAVLTGGAAAPPERAAILFQGADPLNSGNNSIFVSDLEGGHRHELLRSVPGDLLHPDWSPDGRRIVYVVDGQEIATAASSGARSRTLVTCSIACSGVDFPAWSPDSGSIAYTRYVEPGPAGPPASSVIVVRDLRTGHERVVASSEPGQVVDVPRWSPDGHRLVIGVDRFDSQGFETGSAIAVVDLRRSEIHRLTSFSTYAYAPDWSPTGSMLVFSVETRRSASTAPQVPLTLYLMRPDGACIRPLVALGGDRVLFQPAFAPDGRSVVATLDEPGARRGVRIDVRTGELTRLERGEGMTHLKVRPGASGA